MFNEKEDRQYLNEPHIYSLALEKYFNKNYYIEQNHYNSTPDAVYMYTNELQRANIKALNDKPKKKVLTVGSSGDQALTAIINGATKVTIIDANLFSRYWIEYKIAAIKNLTFKEYCKNFINTRYKMFQPEIFRKIFHDLSNDAQVFWGTIFIEELSYNNIHTKLIKEDYYAELCNFFSSKIKYIELQEKLKNVEIEFINAELSNFSDNLHDEYDLINLSNILDYVPTLDFRDAVYALYDNNLLPGGQIQLFYQFGLDEYKSGNKLIYLFKGKQVERHSPYRIRNGLDENFIMTKPEETELQQ